MQLRLLLPASLLLLSACEMSAEDIRARGALDTLTLNKPYAQASGCVATALVESRDASFIVEKQYKPQRTIIKKPYTDGGYFIEVTPTNKKQSQVAVYSSFNAIIISKFAAPNIIRLAKEKCS